MKIENLSSKQRDELHSINPLLCIYGYEEWADMCSDSPDICLPSSMDRQIGIEVTDYTFQKDKMDFSAFSNILVDYIQHISERWKNKELKTYSAEKNYSLTVWLHGGSFPRIEKIKKKKEQIFEELDCFAFPDSDCHDNQYIASAKIDEISNSKITESIVRIPYIEAYGKINEEKLLNCIKGKEEKLVAYKTNDKNRNIREYWLAIIVSDPIQVDIRNFRLSCVLDSSYDKIYLIKGIDCVQIK
jgi:hypothetical protein